MQFRLAELVARASYEGSSSIPPLTKTVPNNPTTGCLNASNCQCGDLSLCELACQADNALYFSLVGFVLLSRPVLQEKAPQKERSDSGLHGMHVILMIKF